MPTSTPAHRAKGEAYGSGGPGLVLRIKYKEEARAFEDANSGGRWSARTILMIAGISIFVGFYLASAGIGASLLDADESPFEESDSDDSYDGCRTCNDVGNLLFVPILGPFLAMKEPDNDTGILIMLGMAQLVGATLTVGGIVRFKKRTRRPSQEDGRYTFDLSRDRTLALDVAASPLMAGPLMKLRF